MGEEVSIYTLDTTAFHEAGYRLRTGPMSQLRLQLPAFMKLRLTEIVQAEVLAHRDADIDKQASDIDAALRCGQRHGLDGLDGACAAFSSVDVRARSKQAYRAELDEFVRQLGGARLLIANAGAPIASELFQRYFATLPPFESKADKKAEFPDAAALLLLEDEAKRNGVLALAVSRDSGWSAFAAQSDHIYCVKSLEDFTQLFASDSDAAKEITAKILRALSDEGSSLRKGLTALLESHVRNSGWSVGEIYTGYCTGVEGETDGADLVDYSFDSDSLDVWIVEHDTSECVATLSLTINADVLIHLNFLAWDSIDRETLSIGGHSFKHSVELEDISLFLRCEHVDLSNSSAEGWKFEWELEDGDYVIDVGEVEPVYEQDPDDHP